MFHNPRAPYTTSNNFTKFTPNFYTGPYILLHVVPTFFASGPPENEGQLYSWDSLEEVLDIYMVNPFQNSPKSYTKVSNFATNIFLTTPFMVNIVGVFIV